MDGEETGAQQEPGASDNPDSYSGPSLDPATKEQGSDSSEAEQEHGGAANDAPAVPVGNLASEGDGLTEPTKQELAQAKKAVEAEERQFEEKAKQDQSAVAALLRYIDDDLVDPNFEMPYFEDPHGSLTYLLGIVQIRRAAQDTRHRQTLIWRVTLFTMIWILAVLAIMALVGAGPLSLPNAVLLTLAGTTTANVLGLALIVLRGMFDGGELDYVRHLEASQPPARASGESQPVGPGA